MALKKVGSDFFHPVRDRISELKPFFREAFNPHSIVRIQICVFTEHFRKSES